MATLRNPIKISQTGGFESRQITMEEVKVRDHGHPLFPFTRFLIGGCKLCGCFGYIYGGYSCNELGCKTLFHKECFELHYRLTCNNGQVYNKVLLLENSNVHEHPLQLSNELPNAAVLPDCKRGNQQVSRKVFYSCRQCDLFFHVQCSKRFPEASHVLHPQHPLKLITCEAAPGYADKKCLLCGMDFDEELHHCDVCNFSICGGCMSNPPPLLVVSPTTHEHQLHLVQRRLDFTCNACGTQGDRSPYFCLQCNFMIHWECIDLPRVININRHNHRISYTHRLGHGDWTCGLCRKKVDGFYGAYSCSKCSDYVVHSRCATSPHVWDMVELEGIPEEPEIPPFEVIDDNTIKHFCHDHNLRINKQDGRRSLHESIECKACVFQICSEPFYSCELCDFVLHQKCANLPRKKRHFCENLPFTLDNYGIWRKEVCRLCNGWFTGFGYKSFDRWYFLDIRCASLSEPLVHESHPHPLYLSQDWSNHSSIFGILLNLVAVIFSCDECDYSLDLKRALLPQKVTRHRYDDHPLYLSYGESSVVDGEYWCEACETKVNPKEWFYTCNDCGTILHIPCVVGDFSYIMPGSISNRWNNGQVVSNNSICRPFCYVCNSRCMLPSFIKVSMYVNICSIKCCKKILADENTSFY